MVGLSVSGNQCSQLSKAQLHIVHSTPQVPFFFFLSFFGGYELINFFSFLLPKKKGWGVQVCKTRELTQCETTIELAASFQAEVAINGLVCHPNMRQPSFSSTL